MVYLYGFYNEYACTVLFSLSIQDKMSRWGCTDKHSITGKQTDFFLTGHEPTSSKEPEVDIGDSGDILLPKPVTPQPGVNKNERRKEGKSKREQEEEEREKMQ